MTGFQEEPIRRSFRPDKQGASRHYGSHPYFTKRAWNVVQEYIKHFSTPGDVVLDPFGGSGVTAVESLVLRRKARYVDISRWACFLARQTALAPVDFGALSDAFGLLEARCRVPLEQIWRRPNQELACEPVAFWYPKNVPLPDNSDVRLVEELFTPRMLHGLALLRAAIEEIGDARTRDLLLLAFSSTLVRVNLTFLSTTNRRETRGGSAVFSIYRYKVAARPVELPLWDQFAQRFAKLVRAKQETNLLIGDYYKDGDTAVFRHGSAAHLDWLQPESINYIYTDPPYGAHISYLDLSTMWSAWLSMNISLSDRKEEVIEGGQLRKSRDDYQQLLSKSIRQMTATLKDRAWLSLVFAHRDTSLWDTIVQACQDAGLTYVNTVVQPVGVVWSMHKKKNPLQVLSGELVMNFQKAPKRKPTGPLTTGCDPEELVVRCCTREIVKNCGATTEDLHHAIVPALLEAGLLAEFSRKRGDITPLLKETFDFDRRTARWHLRESGVSGELPGPQELTDYFISRFVSASTNGEDAPLVALLDYLRQMRPKWRLLPESGIRKRLRILLGGQLETRSKILSQRQLF